MKNNSGTTILILAFLMSLCAGAGAAIKMPPFLVGAAVLLCSALWIWGFFAFFDDWFYHLNQEEQRRHNELINEMRRIYPIYTPPKPSPEPPPAAAAPPSGIQKLPRK